MNLSLSGVYRPHSLPKLLTYSSFSTLCRPFCYSALSSSPTCVKPQVPLFLRPPIYSTKLCDLKKWHDWGKGVALSIGSTFVQSDDGPDSSMLCRELKWLMEDAVVDHSLGVEDDDRVKMRIGIEGLYCLWKQRVQERRPFQYVVGCEHWRDLVLSVQEGVLIPRPETELVVDFVADVVSENEDLRSGVWADLGTGSGALAIGIGRVLGSERGRVIATDLSPVAVSVATYNVQRYCLQDKIDLREGSWFEPLKDMEGKLAGLVSNPPYIPSKDISGLQAEVGRHEPRVALDGGIDGMQALLHLCDGAVLMMKPGGFLAFETNGEQQSRALVDYMKNHRSGSFCNLEIRADFAGIQRFVIGFHQ
ncbi:unnamed protein product [Sphenostylis stenocarpa]|uniref:Methyltransferase small domain-containing protein n=1 Tax=Sphenostylis stenocarpa TaxID=92480 RepID=A0AA86SXN3_9FABA|nr:unnamed protein product [Sphenostylis stenocarpa]